MQCKTSKENCSRIVGKHFLQSKTKFHVHGYQVIKQEKNILLVPVPNVLHMPEVQRNEVPHLKSSVPFDR